MGGEVKTLSNQVDVLSQDVVREVSILDNQKDNLDTENENAKKVTGLAY
jgi:structural maintenance of chromosome 2